MRISTSAGIFALSFHAITAQDDLCTGREACTAQESAEDASMLQVHSAKFQDTKRGDGLAVPLNYVRKPGYGGFQGMAMELNLPTATRPQQALLDLGSSSIAFCDSKLASGVETQKTTYAQCNQYGNPVNTPHWIYPQAYGEYFYGSVYKGDVQALNAKDGQVVADMKDVYYAIMDDQVKMTCELGYDAIFGIAFDGLNSVYTIPAGEDASVLIEKYHPDAPDSPAVCSGNYPTKNLASPIQQSLWAHGEHKYGLYLNSTAIFTSVTGLNKDMGTLYVGPAAVENPIYEACADKNTAKTWLPDSWWDFRVKSASLTPSIWYPEPVVDFPPDFCVNNGNTQCLFDSGNPTIVLPSTLLSKANLAVERAQNVCEEGAHVPCPGSGTMCAGAQCCPRTEQSGNKTFPCPSAPENFTKCEIPSQVDTTCVYPGGGPVPEVTVNLAVLKDPKNETSETSTISLPAKFLLDLLEEGYLVISDQVTMGLPFFMHHYAVFDDDADTMTWCTKQGD